MSDDWIDKPVADDGPSQGHVLRPDQESRLLNIMALLCADVALLETVLWIKQALAEDRDHDAHDLWDSLDEPTQQTLWMAPKYGGIFTTRERKQLRARFDEAGQ